MKRYFGMRQIGSDIAFKSKYLYCVLQDRPRGCDTIYSGDFKKKSGRSLVISKYRSHLWLLFELFGYLFCLIHNISMLSRPLLSPENPNNIWYLSANVHSAFPNYPHRDNIPRVSAFCSPTNTPFFLGHSLNNITL